MGKKTVSKAKKVRPFSANQRKAHLNMVRSAYELLSNFDYGMKSGLGGDFCRERQACGDCVEIIRDGCPLLAFCASEGLPMQTLTLRPFARCLALTCQF